MTTVHMYIFLSYKKPNINMLQYHFNNQQRFCNVGAKPQDMTALSIDYVIKI